MEAKDSMDFFSEIVNFYAEGGCTLKKLKWKDKYEFYKALDCFGYCYHSETSSLRLLGRKTAKQLIPRNFRNDKLTISKNKGVIKKRKCENYGTIILKDLFNEKFTKIDKDRGRPKTVKDEYLDSLVQKQMQRLLSRNMESLLPVDPEEQLNTLRNEYFASTVISVEYSPLPENMDDILDKEILKEYTEYFSTKFWNAKRLKINLKIHKKYFLKINNLIPEIRMNYYTSTKRAFTDILLSDPENRSRLHIKEYPSVSYPVFLIRVPVSWHQSVISGKNFARHNLFAVHYVLSQLRLLWFENYEEMRIVNVNFLEQKGLPMELPVLNEQLDEMRDNSRSVLINKWLPECIDLLLYLRSTWSMLFDGKFEESFQGQKLFNAIYSLMSFQLRRFITNSLNDFLNFILLYKNGNKIPNEYKDYMFLKRSFISINVRSMRVSPFIEFSPSFDDLYVSVQNLFKKIISVSEKIPRIEKHLFPNTILSEKPNLLPVKITESHIQRMLMKVFDCCIENSYGPLEFVKFYDPYFYYLSEKSENDLNTLINKQTSSSLKIFITKIQELILLQKSVRELRCNVPLNLINLKCNEVNEAIRNRIIKKCDMITDHFLNVSKTHNERIMLKFEEVSRRAGEIPESTKDLVELNNFINKSKTVTLFELKKQLLRSAEYIEFLIEYAEIPESIILINTKVFRWPKHLEEILKLASSRVNHKLEAVENTLKTKKNDFGIMLNDRAKQLEVIKKKDPPVLSLSEMKDVVCMIDQFMTTLEEDVVLAKDINNEEELLNIGTTSYQSLYDIITSLKPFSEMWHTVLNFHVSYDKWCNCPFTRLNADEVKFSIENMRDMLFRLLKVFHDIAGAKRIVEIVLSKVEKFYLNVPILQTICNPGMQERHWKKIDEIVGAEIRRVEETTISEILNYGLSKHVNYLQEINVSATEEYALENSLTKMKSEWNGILINHETYRDSHIQVLTGIDDIQVMLDDYLLRIQTMRGSPYVNAIEADIEIWEHKLILMQDILDQWLQVQNTWLYLEPLFSSEDIMRQMPEESENFNGVNKIWEEIMNFTIKNPRILDVIEYPNMMGTLKECNSVLENIKKGLNNYLEKKRLVFPRFFFLSNRELLEILSESKDFSNIESHLKCFEGISALDITDNLDITGIISDKGENVSLNSAISPVEAKGIVERWLDQLEDSMVQSLCDINSKAVRSYFTTPLSKWIFQWPAMISYCAFYINWTTEIENSLKQGSLKDCILKYKDSLNELISLCCSELEVRNRSTINTLIALVAYVLDVIKDLLKSNIAEISSVHWLKQIRYYNEEQNTLIRILRTNLTYGYEYLGNKTRLIMTPQTERCYRFMSSSIEQSLFICLMGGNGSGKTEIYKDFSKAVAKPFCSFRCCENIGYKTISTFLKGCMQMGAWLCFDSIDRMRCEQLSIVAEEVRSIHLAIKEKKSRFKFDGVEIPLNTTCNISFTFVGINNFKSVLPDNLKKVLRPIILTQQNYFHILERTLSSYGFKESSKLADKISEIHKLSNEFVISETHYQTDLRAIKRVLKLIEIFKSDSKQEEEDYVVYKAVKSVYLPKFSYTDSKLLNSIIERIFEYTDQKEKEEKLLRKQITTVLESNNLEPTELFINKVIELNKAAQTHKGIILLGKSFSGKTKAYQMLIEMSKTSDEKIQHCVINPNSMTLEQLYGCLDNETGEWTDGVFSKIYQEYSESSTSYYKWIVFDGLIDHCWIDRLHTIVDDNKKLCLVSGEIIPMKEEMNIIIETDSMHAASPSIIHCCAIISFETEIIGWKCLFSNLLNILNKKLISDQMEIVREIVEWVVPAILEFLAVYKEPIINISENYMFHQFSKLLLNILDFQTNDPGLSVVWLQLVLLFCLVWGFAGNLSEKSKQLFDTFYRNLLAGQNEKYPIPNKFKLTKSQLFPEKETVFDWVCDKKNSGIWIPWMNTVENNDTPIGTKVADLYVYTSENACQMYFLKRLFNDLQPSLLLGLANNGKSTTMLHYLSKLPQDKYISNIINLSAYTTAKRVQDMVMSKIDRRRKGVYGPSMGKKIILAFDDFETSIDRTRTGSESVVELLRQLLEYKFWYDLKDTCRIDLIDFIFTGALSIPSDSFNELPIRFIRHLNLIYSKPLDSATVSTIFTGVLERNLSNNGFSLQICQLSQAIVAATLEVYRKAKNLVSNWIKMPHYFLDYKDVSSVFTGIGLMSAHKCQSVDELFRLWVHELMRVFGDKFTSNSDKEELLISVKSASCQHLRQRIEQYTNHILVAGQTTLHAKDLRNLFFCNFASNESKFYDEVTNINALTSQIKTLIKQNSQQYPTLTSCILFKYAIECISSLVRAFQKDKGHVLILGINGSGRRTVTRLAAIIAQLIVFEIKMELNYNVVEWYSDLKQLLLTAGTDNKSYLLIIHGDQINNEIYFDDINTILSTYDLSHIYSAEEKSSIVNKMMEIAHEEDNKIDTAPATMYNFFIERLRQNLRVAVIINPDHVLFHNRLHMFPSLLKCCSLYWVTPWPEDALEEVAQELLQKTTLSENQKLLNECVKFCKIIHCTAIECTKQYNTQYKKKYSVSSYNYIKFLHTFQELYKNKIEEIASKKNRYKQGLEKLNFTADQVVIMQNELQVLKPKLLVTSDATEKLMIKIEQNTVNIETAKEIVAADEALANEAAAASQAIRDDCESDLSEAEPALISATNALNTLKSSDITVIKAMKNPPLVVKLVLEAVCVMKAMKPEYRTEVTGVTTEDYWSSSLKLLSDAKFLENLKFYDKENIDPEIMTVIRERYITHPDFESDTVKKVSNACEGLCKWVRAMEIYDRVIKIVRPKKIRLTKAEEDYALQMEKLNEKRAQLTEVLSKLQVLRDELAEKTKQKKELEDSIELCVLKLERAGKLIKSLSYEKQRWYELEKELNEALVKSVGDILLSSAFITYLSIFSASFRNEIINSWRDTCKDIKLSLSTSYTFSSNFINSDDIRFWNMAKLSIDPASIDNYTIILKTIYTPVIIDPHGYGKTFILHTEIENDLQVLKATDENYIDNLVKCVQNGNHVLLENISETVDDIVASIIRRDVFEKDGNMYIKIQDEEILFNDSFKLYVTTFLQDPYFNPDLFNKVTIMNFEITIEGLESFLLRVVISADAPNLEEQNNNLLLQCTKDSRTLYQTEDKILNVLSSSVGNILEDETALQTLNDSKNLLEQIRIKQKSSLCAEENLKHAYKPYLIISRQAAKIFFAIKKLYVLNSLYNFSVDWFINLFREAIKKSQKSEFKEQRIHFVNKIFTSDLYNEIDTCLEDKDKIATFFILALEMIPLEDTIKHDVRKMLSPELYGNSIMSQYNANEKYSWMIPYSNSTRIDLEEMNYNFQLASQEVKILLSAYEEKGAIESFLAEYVGTNKFISVIQNFINTQFKEDSEIYEINFYKIYHNSDVRVPIICSFPETDVDPLIEIYDLASEIGFQEENVKCIPFIETQLPSLVNTVLESLNKDIWLVIQNCHLLKNSTKYLEFVNNCVSKSKEIHSQFRLWIITFPFEDFPLTISSKGIKIMMKKPLDLASNLHHLYTYVSLTSSHLLEHRKNVKNWQFLFFFVCMLHSIFKIIWSTGLFSENNSIDLMKINLHINFSLIEMILNTAEDIFLDGLKYLVSECNYNAHISDCREQLTLSSIIESISIGNFAKPTAIVIFNKAFSVPEDVSFNSCLKYAQSAPKITACDHFELFQCKAFKRSEELTNFWKLIRKLYFGMDNMITDEEYTLHIVNDLLELLKPLVRLCKNIPLLYLEDTNNAFLLQEMKLYGRLLDFIIKSLIRLKDTILNKFPISNQCQNMCINLQNNEIPNLWNYLSFPATMSLQQYVVNFNQRILFINKWIQYGQPEVIWLPGIFNLRGFFTLIKYNFAKHHKKSLNEVTLQCEITDYDASSIFSEKWTTFYENQTKKNSLGIFVNGLILLGASWDSEKRSIYPMTPNNYFITLPIIWIQPVTKDNCTKQPVHKCPLYYTNSTGKEFAFENFITYLNLACSFHPGLLTQYGTKLILPQ